MAAKTDLSIFLEKARKLKVFLAGDNVSLYSDYYLTPLFMSDELIAAAEEIKRLQKGATT